MNELQARELIDRLYEQVGTPYALNNALERLREVFSARQALIQTSASSRLQQGVNFAASGINEISLIEYHVHFEAEDVWTRSAVAKQLIFEGSVARGSTLVPPEELMQTRFWRDFLARHEIVDMLSGVLEMPAQAPPTVITLHRAGRQPPFEAADEQRLRDLLPHLRRALRLQRRLAPQLALGPTLKELFNQIAVPMAFVDGKGRVGGGNEAAHAALADAQFLRRETDGMLQWRQESVGWQALAPELGALRVRPDIERLLVSAAGSSRVASLLATRGPLHPLLHDNPVQALLTLRPPEPARDAGLLRSRFSLSPMEWQVALLLDQGLDAATAADALQIQVSTVRTHIRGLLHKTGSAHQLQLLARLRGH